MKICVGCDHGAIELKKTVLAVLQEFPDIEAEDAARMEKMETEILSSIGIANPYEEF